MVENQLLSGLILADKPEGITSFRMDSLVRRFSGVKKVGHVGTLDPFATGLLPICVGSSTRLIRYMDDYDKTYECKTVFGAFSDTQDRTGTFYGGRTPTDDEMVVMQDNNFSAIRSFFDDLVGDRLQHPPQYSAIKISGRPAYSYARKGLEVDIKPRRISIFSTEVLSIEVQPIFSVVFRVRCSKGTYIRSICQELGEFTGYGAYASSLRRTTCGALRIEDAVTLDKLEELSRQDQFSKAFLSDLLCVEHLPQIEVGVDETNAIRQGKKLPLQLFEERLISAWPSYDESTRYRAMSEGKLVAVVYPRVSEEERILKIERMLYTQ